MYLSNRPGSSAVLKEAIAVGNIAAEALGYVKDKRELTKGIGVFMTSTGVSEVLLGAIKKLFVFILHAPGFVVVV